jgi:malonyl-CoA/methylmalonyl-CoA synthetase
VSHDGFVFERAASHDPDRVAIVAGGREYTYGQVSAASAAVAVRLLDGRPDLAGRRVAFLVQPGFAWVSVQWGIWRAGGTAVPLAMSHPARELEHVIEDCTPSVIITDADQTGRVRLIAQERSIPLLETHSLIGSNADSAAITLPRIDARARATILYTSGTTGRPKGVVATHASVTAQITTLVDAWGWSEDDRILHVLPLHHVHGIINVLSCAMWSGACCEFLPRFEAEPVWQRMASGEITMFMAVPTIYHRLIATWEAATPSMREAWSGGSLGLRLMVSGSAALPVRTLQRWREITGHTLLERYGMTEIGMALSNPLHGERRAGTVGQPLAGVTARIVDDSGEPLTEGSAGQIEVRGPQVFGEYWQRPEETAKAFRDGWFVTGDEAVIEDGYWRILGRRSTDIIKSGGYKISALEIEDALREHEAIHDCAVVGLPDEDLGERIAVAIVGSETTNAATLAAWARDRIAPYKVPRDFRFVDELPRNAMGKVTKPAVRELFD